MEMLCDPSGWCVSVNHGEPKGCAGGGVVCCDSFSSSIIFGPGAMGLAAFYATIRCSLKCLLSLHSPLQISVVSRCHEEAGVVDFPV